MEFITIILLILLGVLVSLVSTLLGIGGGIIAIPLMFSFIKNLPPSTAAGTMLCIIGINCSINCYNYYKKGLAPRISYIIPLLLSITAGSIIGSNLSMGISPHTFKVIFILLLIITAIKNFFIKIPVGINNSNWTPPKSVKKRAAAAGFIFLGGVLSGFSGLGGGIVIIPTLLLLYAPPVRVVPIYSNFIMALGSIAGGISYLLGPKALIIPFLPKLQVGQVNLGIMLLILLGATLTSKIGISIGQKIPQKAGKNLFSVLLLLMAIKILVSL